ncbi:MAG: ribosome recycling factor [Phycisphaeraceae bacterium]|nr:ribosome recycling factor [Phycisphaeraceae bacterium]
MDPKSIKNDAETSMVKALEYLKSELRGIRTGRASPALVEYVKVDYYGSMTDLKSLAMISVPEATQIVITPFDPQSLGEIRRALEASDLGLNPRVDGKAIRVSIPPLSGERRQQLVGHAKKMGEEAKVSMRNVRRDANKHADGLKNVKAVNYSEDVIEGLKEDIQTMLKKHEGEVDVVVAAKSKEILEV